MKKYIALYKQLLSINLSLFLMYRINIINEFIGTSVWTLLAVSTMFLVTQKAKMVAGWNQGELLMLAGGLLVILGFFEIHFKRSFQHLPDIIYYGNLDNLLLKPIDSQFMISFMQLKFMGFWRLTMGILFIIFVVQTFHLHITWISTLLFSFLILFGLITYYSIWLMAATLLIWHPRLSNILDVTNSLNHVSRFPPEMYQEFNIMLYLFLLPYMFIVASPVKVMLQKASILDFIGLISAAIVLFVCSRFFWKFALKYYTSASG